MRRLEKEMDSVFGNGNAKEGQLTTNWSPRCDVKETEKGYVIHAELPGVNKEDINIEVKDNVLSITGQRKEEKIQEKEKWHRTERFFGSFQRSMLLPEGVTDADIKAKLENGVLEITFPKPVERKPETKKITVG